MQLLLSNTEQRRCRLQGLQDASLHFGWVQSYESNLLTVEVSSKRAIRKGDFMYLEVSAPTALLTFVAYVTEAAGSTVAFQISSEVEERSLKSESRIRIRAFEGEINGPKSSNGSRVTVVDVSENGFGFLSQQAVEVSGPCHVVLNSVHGDIKLTGDVRHARNDKDLAAFRGGVLITDMDRVSRARWVRLVGG